MKYNIFSTRKQKTDGKKKTFKTIVSVTLAMVMLVATVFATGTERQDKSSQRLGSSGIQVLSSSLGASLGASGNDISTVEDLVDLSKRVARGDNFAGATFVLTQDLSLSALEKWEPIGTAQYPFNGTFEGNNFTISGVGTSTHPSVFGFLKKATLKNLTVMSIRSMTEDRPYHGLFISAEESTIINCQVLTAALAMSDMLRSTGGTTPDPGWRSSGKITSFAHLLDLEGQVAGGNTYAGVHITINFSNMTEKQSTEWKGIGSRETGTPFSGIIDSAKINGMWINQPSMNDVGLFGYTKGAELNKIELTDVQVSGADHTGGIVGYAEDTIITDSFVTGEVNGTLYVGGLVGTQYASENFATDMNISGEAVISKSYSTANVSGTLFVGGLMGYHALEVLNTRASSGLPLPFILIDTAFTTGNITGSAIVGGAIGHVESETYINNWDGIIPQVKNVGVMANVDAGQVAGGIIGTTQDGDTTGLVAAEEFFPRTLSDSYFAGTLTAMDAAGGLIGASYSDIGGYVVYRPHTLAKDCYVSGKVIVPAAHNSENNWAFMGMMSTGDSVHDFNLWAGPNTVFEPANPLNKDASRSTFEKQSGGGVTLSGGKHNYFGNGSVGAAFTSGSLDYSKATTGRADTYVPTPTSTYPTLNAFTNAGGMFKTFSDISTASAIVDIPYTVQATTVGTTTSLHTSSGQMALTTAGIQEWTFDNESSVEVEDNTLDGGINTLTLTSGSGGNKIITATAPLASSFDFVLKGTTQIPGFALENQVTVLDTAVRPEYERFHNVLFDNPTDAFALDNGVAKYPMAVSQNIFYIRFPEGIALSSSTVNIIWAEDAAFTTPTTVPMTARLVGGKTLRLGYANIANSPMNFNRFFKIDLRGVTIDDIATPDANNWAVSDLYFRTGENSIPVISFDPAYEYQTSTSADGFTQKVELYEDITDFGGILDGIAEPEHADGTHVNVVTDTSIATIRPNPLTVGGKGNVLYPTAPDKTNFFQIPGTYLVDYQVEDPDYDGMPNPPLSNIITRTYEVSSKAYIMQGLTPFKYVEFAFDEIEILAISELSASKNISLQAALALTIQEKYIDNANPADKLAAFYYAPTAELTNLPITFHTGDVADESFVEGVEQVLFFTTPADSRNHMFVLKLASATPRKEIVLKNSSFVMENTFSKQAATRHFGATVYDKVEKTTETGGLIYDFSKVNRSHYDVAQDVTITLASTKGKMIAGKSVEVSAKASVTIKKVIKAPEEDLNPNATFWDATIATVRDGKDDKTYNIDMSYDNGKHFQTDFFRVVRNKDNVTANMNYPSGITLSLHSDDLDSTSINEMEYNMGVERMYDLYIDRDAAGHATQQFATDDQLATLPGKVTVSMPLDDALVGKSGLALYAIDDTTGRYELVETLSDGQASSDVLTLELEDFAGRYVVSAAKLDGKTTTAR